MAMTASRRAATQYKNSSVIVPDWRFFSFLAVVTRPRSKFVWSFD